MSRQQKARAAGLKSRMSALRRFRSELPLGKLRAAERRSAQIERLESRVLLSTWAVNTLNDIVANDGVLSLREAISTSASGDAITFDAALAGGMIVLNGTQLQILNKTLSIVGPGADELTISGSADPALYSRMFYLSGSTVNIEGLTITGGHATYDSGYGYSAGGAIYSDSSTVTISSSVLRGNKAAHNTNTHGLQAAYGGAIYNSSSSLTISDSILSGNSTSTDLVTSSTGDGGAIYNASGILTINNSILSGNTASSGNPDGCFGGAIYNSGALTIGSSIFSGNDAYTSGGAINSVNPGTLTISDSTFNANTTSYNGGAIRIISSALVLTNSTLSGNRAVSSYGGAIQGSNSTLTLTNSTFSGNKAFGIGGAIHASSASNLTLTNCTLTGNSVTAYSGITGGAIYNSSSTVIARNSIVSGNVRQSVADDIYGALDPSSSHNLIGVGGGLANGVNGNIVGVNDPKLAALADNGGPTQTIALLAGSPALDAGDNSLIPAGTSDDQRGAGHARIAHGTVDIGAYENGLPNAITLSNASVAENRPAGTVVGSFGTTDPDPLDTFTYTVVSGTGDSDNASFAISGNELLTAASFNYEAKNSYSIRVRSTDQSGLWVEQALTINVNDVDEIAPTVTAVYVRGSTWASGYLSFLAANVAGSSSIYGYAIPIGTGSSQLQTLPWRNLNRISLAFSEDVSIAQAQFAIVGSVGSYSVSGFSYNSTDHVATWSLSAAIGPDKLYVALPGGGTGPITDLAGNVLDGEWSNPTSYSDAGPTDTFPSGNGTAGGDFAFRLDVLPGDSTGGSLGKVNVADIAQTKSRSGLPVSISTYRSDFDGNNLVNVADIAYVKSRSGLNSLPVNPPSLPAFGPVFSQVSLLQKDRSEILR